MTKYLVASPDAQSLLELPFSWQDLEPELLRPVFPVGKPAEIGELAREICEFVHRMRLRKDNRWLQEGVGGTTSMPVGKLSAT